MAVREISLGWWEAKIIPKKTFWTHAHNHNLNEEKCEFFSS